MTHAELVGEVEKRDLVIVNPDPFWPQVFDQHKDRIRVALGTGARKAEHIGSTAVPGLAAKPIIDILVTVDDITAEEEYLGPLLNADYQLRVREPKHRMVRTPEQDERTKRELIRSDWADMNAYAEAKTTVITLIMERARETV